MSKKSCSVSLKYFRFTSFAFMISIAFILAPGVNSALAAKKADAQKGVPSLVDINSATQEQLEGIKGIGPSIAKKVIVGRPYKSIDELSRAGISERAIDALSPFVFIGGEQASSVKAAAKSSPAGKRTPGAKININKADQATLEKLPGIGPGKAKAIMDGRPYKTIEDVMRISDIKKQTFDAIKDYIVVQ